LTAKGWCSFVANHWCILSRVLTRGALYHPPPFPLDVVFFDLEERGQIGSRA